MPIGRQPGKLSSPDGRTEERYFHSNQGTDTHTLPATETNTDTHTLSELILPPLLGVNASQVLNSHTWFQFESGASQLEGRGGEREDGQCYRF